jgi:hypothetical protein
VKFISILLLSAVSLLAQNAVQPAPAIPAVPQELLGKGAAVRLAPRKSEAASAQPQAAAPTIVSDGYELQVSADSPITIPVGEFKVLPQSDLDFTGVNHARIALQSVNSADITGLRIFTSWAAVGTFFNVADMSSDGAYALYAPTYGPCLRLIVYNGSSSPIQIRQLSVYTTK